MSACACTQRFTTKNTLGFPLHMGNTKVLQEVQLFHLTAVPYSIRPTGVKGTFFCIGDGTCGVIFTFSGPFMCYRCQPAWHTPRQRKHESAQCRTIYHKLYSIFMTSPTAVLPSCEIFFKKKRVLPFFSICHVAPHFNLKHNNLIYLTFYPGSKASYRWVGSSNPV